MPAISKQLTPWLNVLLIATLLIEMLLPAQLATAASGKSGDTISGQPWLVSVEPSSKNSGGKLSTATRATEANSAGRDDLIEPVISRPQRIPLSFSSEIAAPSAPIGATAASYLPGAQTTVTLDQAITIVATDQGAYYTYNVLATNPGWQPLNTGLITTTDRNIYDLDHANNGGVERLWAVTASGLWRNTNPFSGGVWQKLSPGDPPNLWNDSPAPTTNDLTFTKITASETGLVYALAEWLNSNNKYRSWLLKSSDLGQSWSWSMVVGPGNLIPNGDFEAGHVNGWASPNNPPDNVFGLSTNAHNGSYALYTYNGYLDNTYAYLNFEVLLAAVYTATGWYQQLQSGGTGSLRINENAQIAAGTVQEPPAWKFGQIPVNLGLGSHQVRLYKPTYPWNTSYADDISVVFSHLYEETRYLSLDLNRNDPSRLYLTTYREGRLYYETFDTNLTLIKSVDFGPADLAEIGGRSKYLAAYAPDTVGTGGAVYAFGRFDSNGQVAHLYRSSDAGLSFQVITNTALTGEWLAAVQVSTNTLTTFANGLAMQPYSTPNGGSSWTPGSALGKLIGAAWGDRASPEGGLVGRLAGATPVDPALVWYSAANSPWSDQTGNLYTLSSATQVRRIVAAPFPPLLTLDVLDPQGNLVTDILSLNDDSWPTPNPLTVRVTLNCPAGGADCLYNSLYLNIAKDSPSSNEPRFNVYATQPNVNQNEVEVVCAESDSQTSPYSRQSYSAQCTKTGPFNLFLSAGETKVLQWSLWVQPSPATAVEFTATWGPHTDNQVVQIPQAKINPLIFLPGYLGTYPPASQANGGKLEPIDRTYDNLMEALQQTGYELNDSLIPYPYDYRIALQQAGTQTLAQTINNILTQSPLHAYVDYSQVDILTHSTGGLIARAYIEDATTDNTQNVDRMVLVAAPNRGLPVAYLGWYGGRPEALNLSSEKASWLLWGIGQCEGSIAAQDASNQVKKEGHFFSYVRNHMPSVQDFIPGSGYRPASGEYGGYLVKAVAPHTAYPYPLPGGIAPFGAFQSDLNSTGGNLDVSRLLAVRQIHSVFGSGDPNPEEVTKDGFFVDPSPPSGDLWQYGVPVAMGNTGVITSSGDGLVPTQSGNLQQVLNAANIIAVDEGEFTHEGLVEIPEMVRRILGYITGIPVEETFWTKPPIQRNNAQRLVAIVSCSPIRLLVTDQLGRRTGHDLSTGQLVNEIPDAYVSEPGQAHQLIVVPSLANEQLQITGRGIDQGFYQVGIIYNSKTSDELIESFATGQTVVGQNYQFSFDTFFPQEANGQVVIEAEDFTWSFGLGARTWITQTTLAGYIGSGYLSAIPDTDLQLATVYTDSPRLRYTINFTTTGTYYAWLRGYAPNAAGDSVYLGLNSDGQSAAVLTGFAPRTWGWSNKDTQGGPVTINVTEPGVHTLYLWQREDGLRLDRIVLTTDSGYNPSGDGPPKSQRLDSLN